MEVLLEPDDVAVLTNVTTRTLQNRIRGEQIPAL